MKERRGPSPFLSALFSFPLPPRLLSFSTIFYLLRVPRSRRFCSSPLFFSSFFRPRTPGIQRCWTVATQQAIVQLFLAGTPKVRYISGAAIRGPLRDVTRWRLVRPNLPLFPPGFLNTVFPKAARPPLPFSCLPFLFPHPFRCYFVLLRCFARACTTPRGYPEIFQSADGERRGPLLEITPVRPTRVSPYSTSV